MNSYRFQYKPKVTGDPQIPLSKIMKRGFGGALLGLRWRMNIFGTTRLTICLVQASGAQNWRSIHLPPHRSNGVYFNSRENIAFTLPFHLSYLLKGVIKNVLSGRGSKQAESRCESIINIVPCSGMFSISSQIELWSYLLQTCAPLIRHTRACVTRKRNVYQKKGPYAGSLSDSPPDTYSIRHLLTL